MNLTMSEEHLTLSVQEFQPSFTQLIAEQKTLPNEVFKTCDSETLSEFKKKKNQNSEKHEVHEEAFLRLPELDHPSILRYLDAAEDENFGYLALEEYVKNNIINNNGLAIKYLVKDILRGLMALHHHKPPILHGDLNKQNVLIDANGKAKLADFHKSRYLEDEAEIQNKLSSDIQMAGKLIYYILSGGHRLSSDGSSLGYVQDVLALDLIERMTNKDIQKRLKVAECLQHPLFWTTERRGEYLRRVGNKNEIQNYKNPYVELISLLEGYDRNDCFNPWKTKLPRELKIESWRPYSENAFALLRYYRNLCEHHPEVEVDMMAIFPDLFGCVYKFAEDQGWNSEPPLKDVFSFTTEDPRGTTRGE